MARKRKAAPRGAVQPEEIKLLRMKSVQEKRQLKKFLKRMESMGKIVPPTDNGLLQASKQDPHSKAPFSGVSSHQNGEVNPFLLARQDSDTKPRHDGRRNSKTAVRRREPVGFNKQHPNFVTAFFDAPESFKRDGTPVTDHHEAKMHFEGAKERRKLLRRQSTISSLSSSITNSVSLHSAEVRLFDV